ncbi:MAG: tRNA uridine-5-carboxymethylaminomethyl(34) synthesis GTPase MnmE [Candidatus Zixiibacteriota bacterium]
MAAVITPPGQGGVAAMRIAGPGSRMILEKLFRPSSRAKLSPFLMRHGHVVSCSGELIDEALAVFMPSGRSYTGLDQAEIFCHGGSQVVKRILEATVTAGARPAQPGEFTKLAFLNGRIDLAKAEAVAEIIAASTETSYRASREHLVGSYSRHVEKLRSGLLASLADLEVAIDFSEEDIGQTEVSRLKQRLDGIASEIDRLASSYKRGRIIREGFRVVICGRPNAGKSSLFNLLLKQERALVDPEAGTTRDYLSEWIDLDGFAVNIIDTAGLRIPAGRVEMRGQAKARELIDSADLILWLADMTLPEWQNELEADTQPFVQRSNLLIANKIDVVSNAGADMLSGILPLSCVTGEGLERLRSAVLHVINAAAPDLTSGQVVTSARHKRCLDEAAESIARASAGMTSGESPEILAFELRQAADQLGEITGQVYTEEILGEIFSRFCIGK